MVVTTMAARWTCNFDVMFYFFECLLCVSSPTLGYIKKLSKIIQLKLTYLLGKV